jgi:AbrB family looped-hinge helix DNA binding protein
MKTTVSSKGQIVLPAELRQRDDIRAGQEFEVEGAQRLQCLPWEVRTGLRWAELLARLRGSGRSMPIKDSLIAATALVHGLVVATRNRTGFEKAGVRIVEPFAG